MNSISRGDFIRNCSLASLTFALPFQSPKFSAYQSMKDNKQFDVIIIGGSYSGLAAGMALGRALRKVLVIDSGQPCNRQTPHSHNFITQDGMPPGEIAAIARQQVEKYDTVRFLNGLVTSGEKTATGFEVQTEEGETFTARKLIFATGIKDIMPEIPGFAECWGISVLHCPYCHGYEVRDKQTGILGNGDYGFEFSSLISNWTGDLTLYTNGPSTLTREQKAKLERHRIRTEETAIESLEHRNGYLQNIIFKNGQKAPVKAIYARCPFVQHCRVPEMLGCELTTEGYIEVGPAQQTTVSGVFACGDNTNRIRTVANAIATGTTTGIMVNKALLEESF